MCCVVLRNPVYFIFLITCGAALYVTYTLNLWGPIINMTTAASNQALAEGKKRLRDFLQESEAGRQAMAMSSSSARDEVEMRNLNRRKAKVDGVDEDDDEI